jgi:hypothetical protein
VQDVIDRPVDLQWMRDVVPDKRELIVTAQVLDVVAASRDAVVHAQHFVPFRQAALAQVRTDEAGSAGDQGSHGPPFLLKEEESGYAG